MGFKLQSFSYKGYVWGIKKRETERERKTEQTREKQAGRK